MSYSGDMDQARATTGKQTGGTRKGGASFAGDMDSRPKCDNRQGQNYIKPQSGQRTSGSSKPGKG